MKKNDKLIVIIGVIILIIASVGIYFWAPSLEETENVLPASALSSVSGKLSHMPNAIMVSDSDPFYALIATPLAVNYDKDGGQNIVPLYVVNFDEPSRSIVRAVDQIGVTPDEVITGSQPANEVSLALAEKYWDNSNGVILIKDDQSGYNLGVLATPLASYLRIPVIVADEVNEKVTKVLQDLGVKYSIVCGDLTGYGKILRFENADDVVDAAIEVVKDKFDKVNYITITNPIDAREPQVLDQEEKWFKATLVGGSLLPSQLGVAITHMSRAFGEEIGTFTIPKDYKYALVKFDGRVKYNDPENPDEMGSSVNFKIDGPDTIFGSGLSTSSGGVAIRDEEGNLITDRVYNEGVLYGRGGAEYTVSGKAMLFATKECEVTVHIVIEKLSDPLYPMMKKLSSVAPYLTAYHKGIIFGKPEFAFVADDNVRTEKDETCPGPYVPRINSELMYASNKHVSWIHDQINELLGKLAGISVDDLKTLRDYYTFNPVYITLVGGATVLPQAIYDNYLIKPDDYIGTKYGIGIPSDVIYGNIDPIPNDFTNTADDVYTKFPYQENIVGRITGWDVQDACALIDRNIFYDKIIEKLGDWKDKATVQTGCGTDFLKPRLAEFINRLRGNTEPVKWPSGCTDLNGDRLQKAVLEPLGFTVYRTKHTASQCKGFSDDAIKKIQKANLLSRILFAPRLVKMISGEDHVKGGKYLEECNIIWQNGHGMPNMYSLGDICTDTLGWRFFPLLFNYLGRTLGYIINTGLTIHGSFSTRNVENLNLGPSIMIVESCFTGKIDGLYPKTAISQAAIHAGVATYIAATTESNVPGGYLEPYGPGRYNIRGYIVSTLNAKKGIWPPAYFGHVIYRHFFNKLGEDKDVGTAFREARNLYLPEDINSTFRWVPPLSETGTGILLKTTGSSTGSENNGAPNVPRHKYMTYYEYTLYGDPAFNPYIPGE